MRAERAMVLLACAMVAACKPSKSEPAPAAPPPQTTTTAAEPPDDPRVKCPPDAKQYIANALAIGCRDAEGLNHGPHMFFFPNGRVATEEHYVHGRYEGIKKDWYENGKLDLESHYEDGELEGIGRTWYENGQLETETHWHKGLAVGPTHRWDEHGRRLKDEQ